MGSGLGLAVADGAAHPAHAAVTTTHHVSPPGKAAPHLVRVRARVKVRARARARVRVGVRGKVRVRVGVWVGVRGVE